MWPLVLLAEAAASGRFLDHPSDPPRLGLGLAALGRPGYINLNRSEQLASLGDGRSRAEMEKHCHAVLDEAYEQGVRYFDAARSYGCAEAFLSSWLAKRGLAPSDVAVGSKWGYYYTADWRIDTDDQAPHEVKDHSLDRLVTQSAESLNLFKDGHLHLYQIHSATLESGVLTNGDVLRELRSLKARGLRIGLSVSGPRQADVVRLALSIQPPLFDSVQATFNLMDQSAGAVLAEARDAGLEVIVKEAMANGRLLQEGTRAGDAVERVARSLNAPPDAVCLAAVIMQPFRPMVLSGACTGQQVVSNAKALLLADSGRLSPELNGRLMAECKMEPELYWQERSELQWN